MPDAFCIPLQVTRYIKQFTVQVSSTHTPYGSSTGEHTNAGCIVCTGSRTNIPSDMETLPRQFAF